MQGWSGCMVVLAMHTLPDKHLASLPRTHAQKVSSGLSDRVVFVKIDTDKYPALASQYRIEALPTLVLFKDGRPIDRIEGVINVGQLQARLQLALGPTK